MDIKIGDVEVGSVVTLKGVIVESKYGQRRRILLNGSEFENNIDPNVQVFKVEEAPLKVGDHVNVESWGWQSATIIYIDDQSVNPIVVRCGRNTYKGNNLPSIIAVPANCVRRLP